jgi:glycosyltransferase involved in cell wall biosynthesis
MKKKRIIWLAHEANKSGANLCLKEFMQIASSFNYEQMLILPHKGNMESVANEMKIPVKIIPYYSWIRRLNDNYFDSNYLKRIVRNTIAVFHLIFIAIQYRANIIFTNTSVINLGAWVSICTGKRHYWYIHEMGEEDFGFRLPWGRLSIWFMKISSRKILTNSNHLASKYIKKYNKLEIKVLRYPVFITQNYQPLEWKEGATHKILLLGQIAETKGHHFAIEAISILKKQNFNILFTIVGKCENESYKNLLDQKIKEFSLQEVVHFVDYTDDPIKVISEHHILLMTSRCEAFGRVTIEAMKTGVPVIGSNTCGTKEIISHLETGYLFEQGNVKSLALAIQDLIKNEKLRNKIIQQAIVSAYKLTDTEGYNILFH